MYLQLNLLGSVLGRVNDDEVVVVVVVVMGGCFLLMDLLKHMQTCKLSSAFHPFHLW